MKTDNVTIPRYEVDNLINVLQQAAANTAILIGRELEDEKRAAETGNDLHISLESIYRFDLECINLTLKKLSSI